MIHRAVIFRFKRLIALSKTVVIALGGNAIKKSEELGTAEEQFANIRNTTRQILAVIKNGYRVVMTHGNGPQVGNLLIQQEQGRDLVPAQPLSIAGAMTQGQIGYMLQQTLMNYLKESGLSMPVITIITQVLVSKDSNDFQNPSKPVGPFYSKSDAERLKIEKGYVINRVKPGRGKSYRRIVPSPDPIDIVEKDLIRRLVDMGAVVIAAGGGGIPVIKGADGGFEGVDAVIDKDLAAEKLAEAVGADVLLVLTDVDGVKLNYGKPDQKDLHRLTMAKAAQYLEEGHFLSGSMKPKVVACMRFIESGGKKAIIASLDKIIESLKGRSGTVFLAE